MNFMRMETVLREIIDSELKSIAIVGSIIMVNTDNGFFDCHAEHADPDQTRLPDTDIYLSTVSYLSSDDELLIKCDENTSYLCDTLSSVNKKNCGKCELNEKELTIKHLSAGTQKNMVDKAARMISH